jgi:hypothetical protein
MGDRQNEVAMTLDEELLRRAREEGARLAEAERQVLLARAEYHASVRRLHLAGGALREIAQALALSHQRVQQIVEAAGGSWWQRLWRSRNTRDALCTACDRPPSEVAKLVAGPDVYLCDACIARAERALAGEPAAGFSPAGARAACSFCGKRRARERPLLAGPKLNLCADCLRICREIIDGRAP